MYQGTRVSKDKYILQDRDTVGQVGHRTNILQDRDTVDQMYHRKKYNIVEIFCRTRVP